MPVDLCSRPCPLCETCPPCSSDASQLMAFLFNELKRYSATAWYIHISVAVCTRSMRTWWVGRGINGGSAELDGGATVYLDSI